MNHEQFIEKNLREKLPGIDNAAIEAAITHYRRNQSEKKVTFSKPVRGRYIRFTALSEQSGNDFASGAEITIQAE